MLTMYLQPELQWSRSQCSESIVHSRQQVAPAWGKVIRIVTNKAIAIAWTALTQAAVCKRVQVACVITKCHYGELEGLDESPVVVLSCGHVFSVRSMDHWMGLSDVYNLSEEGMYPAQGATHNFAAIDWITKHERS